jgi:hypothetical protein
MRCTNKITNSEFCLRLISDDSDYVRLESGELICAPCVDKILTPPIPSYDGGHQGKTTMKAAFCESLGVVRTRRV